MIHLLHWGRWVSNTYREYMSLSLPAIGNKVIVLNWTPEGVEDGVENGGGQSLGCTRMATCRWSREHLKRWV